MNASDWSMWTPMIVSAAVIGIPALIFARMASTVASRLVKIDEGAVQTATSRRTRMTIKQTEKFETERDERWATIRKYRRASAGLLLGATTFLVIYGIMASLILFPPAASLSICAVLLVIEGLVIWRLMQMTKAIKPESGLVLPEADAG